MASGNNNQRRRASIGSIYSDSNKSHRSSRSNRSHLSSSMSHKSNQSSSNSNSRNRSRSRSHNESSQQDHKQRQLYNHLKLYELRSLCESAHDDRGWEKVRNWFLSHSTSESRAAVRNIGPDGTTAIHMACKNSAPLDIIEMFLNACAASSEFQDSHGWCPLHYACHYGDRHNEEVLKVLILSCPKMLKEEDEKGRVPLHFAASGSERVPFTGEIFTMLTQSGAAMRADHKGMLPIHYSCAYGTSTEVLGILIDAYPESVQYQDRKGFTPLHYAMGNCERDESPGAIELLLSRMSSMDMDINMDMDTNSTNSNKQQFQLQQQQEQRHEQEYQGGRERDREQGIEHKHPLLVLSDRTKKFKMDVSKRECENAQRCLRTYLRRKPPASMNFFTALQSLPQWLEDIAVVEPYVQQLLNQKISQRFPTAIMMLDFYAIVALLVTYMIAVINCIDRRSDYMNISSMYNNESNELNESNALNALNEVNEMNDSSPLLLLLPLYIVGAYFAVRECVQILSFIHLGLFFTSWFQRGTNWMEISLIVQVFFWTVVMETGAMSLEFFQTGTTITLFFLWLNFLNYLRGMIVEFAVFVSGVVHVLKRLGVFLMALLIILIAFMQIFYTLFLASGYCDGFEADRSHVDTCDPEEGSEPYRFCTNWDTFLSVYTMLLGEVDEGDFETSVLATIAFIFFVFLVVILLANVLIAIVTDSYSVIRNERAAIVFWSNRLDFIVEMNVISNGPVMRRVKHVFCGNRVRPSQKSTQGKMALVPNLWTYIVELFEADGPYLTVEVWSMAFVCLNFLRAIAILIVIPIWFILGLCTVGLFWPPQIRQKLMRQRISRKRSAAVVKIEQQKYEIRNLKNSVGKIRRELATSLAKQKEEIEEIRTEMTTLHSEVISEMHSIKETLDALFQLHNY